MAKVVSPGLQGPAAPRPQSQANRATATDRAAAAIPTGISSAARGVPAVSAGTSLNRTTSKGTNSRCLGWGMCNRAPTCRCICALKSNRGPTDLSLVTIRGVPGKGSHPVKCTTTTKAATAIARRPDKRCATTRRGVRRKRRLPAAIKCMRRMVRTARAVLSPPIARASKVASVIAATAIPARTNRIRGQME